MGEGIIMPRKIKDLFDNKSGEEQIRIMAGILANQSVLLSRSKLAAQLGQSYGGERDIYTALGYKKNLTFDDFFARYERQDIARRIVDAYPNASWRLKPEIKEEGEEEETKFQKEWKILVKNKKVFHYLVRTDRISGIGSYGVLFLGFDDMTDTEMAKEPVVNAGELLFMRPYTMDNAKIYTWENDPKNERFGLPETYQLSTQDNPAGSAATLTSNIIVHHSRVLHFAEGLSSNDVEGVPRLKNIYNRLQDLELIVGGSSEMFWRGAFPGLALEADADADLAPQAMSELKDEIEDYIHKLNRYMRLQGITAKELSQQVADPKNHVDVQVMIISGATGIPKRILTGSEMGELASSQDEKNWLSRVDERREDYNEPMILRPFIDRLIKFGVLPEPKNKEYTVKWPDLFAPGEKEVVDINKVKMDMLVEFSNSQAAGRFPMEKFLEIFLDMSKDEIEEIEYLLQEQIDEEEYEEEESEDDYEEV